MNHRALVGLRLGLLGLVWAGVSGCQSTPQNDGPQDAAAEAFFLREVKPILERNCLLCHNGRTLPGRMDLSHRTAAFAGTTRGRAYLVPGQPAQSLLLQAVGRPGGHPMTMPKRDLSLTDDEVGTLREWIADGAAWPIGPSGILKPAANPEIP